MVTLFGVGMGASAAPAFQARLMDVAGDAQALAAALNHSAFNVANAVGTALGRLVVAAGFDWTAIGWVGALLSVLGIFVLLWSFRVEAIMQRGE
jgi:MFS transporter, DHA1 family, inner membrane transport protein